MRNPTCLALVLRGTATAAVLGTVAAVGLAFARSDDAAPPAGEEPPAAASEDPGASHEPHEHDPPGSAEGPVIPMAQEGSGTGWVPAASPMHGHHVELGPWSAMAHYSLFAGVAAQGSRQREIEGLTANWFMGMARRDLGAGRITGRAMLSLEPLLMERDGYPLLLQTGEAAYGEPLVDRQHPHDLFMELALAYDRPLTSRLGLQVYAAPSGEPALGPVAFPHRPSAAADPLAPIAHHWQDSSHISFGVLTAGLYTSRVKVEGSWFNGREPDEHRADLDLRAPDSWAGRVSLNPTDAWSFQASYGHLREPEALEPGAGIRRITSSLMHTREAAGGTWASTLAWGRNASEEGPTGDSWLVESTFTRGRHAAFGRAELVEKDAHDFALEVVLDQQRLPVGELSAGYSFELLRLPAASVALGAGAYVGRAGRSLEEHRYGTSRPTGGLVFVHVRPAPAHAGH